MNLISLHAQSINDETAQTVNARELHAFLEVGKDFSNWIKDRVEQYGFVQGTDFIVIKTPLKPAPDGVTAKTGENLGGRPRKECFITLDMAKELAMVERNARGKQARQYFIECEKRLRGENVHHLVPNTLPEALRLAADLAEKVENQSAVISYLEPRAQFHDSVAEAINCQTVQEVAKILGTGPNRFFCWLRDNKILMRNRMPYQQYIDAGYFRVIENQYKDKHREVQTYTRTLITGRGLIYLQKRYTKAA